MKTNNSHVSAMVTACHYQTSGPSKAPCSCFRSTGCLGPYPVGLLRLDNARCLTHADGTGEVFTCFALTASPRIPQTCYPTKPQSLCCMLHASLRVRACADEILVIALATASFYPQSQQQATPCWFDSDLPLLLFFAFAPLWIKAPTSDR